MTDNSRQAAAWNGPEGTNWAEHSAERVDDGDLIEPLLDAAAIAGSALILDIGCGTGDLTLQAARRAPAGFALGIDLSEQMIDQGRERAGELGIDNASFVVGDAAIHPFDEERFDVAVSHFGSMFFADPVVAFANIARAVRPDGRLALVVPQAMGRCDWYTVPLAALLGEQPNGTSAPSAMFSFADPAAVGQTLTAAGWHSPTLTPLNQSLWFGKEVPTAVEGYLGSGPVAAILERGNLPIAVARTRLNAALAPYLADDGVRIPGSSWLVQAGR